MLRAKTIHFKKLYQSFFMPYILVLLIPTILTIFGYLYSINIISQDTYKYHNTILRQEQRAYDNIFFRIESMLTILSTNSYVSVISKKSNWDTADRFKVADLYEDIISMCEEFDCVDTAGICFVNSQNFVTNKGTYASPTYVTYLNHYQLTQDKIISNMDKLSGCFIFISNSEQNLFLYHRVYNNSYTKVAGYCYAIIPWNSIKGISEVSALSKNGGTFLINKEGIIFGNSNTDVDVSSINASTFSKDTEMKYMNLNGYAYVVSAIKSLETDFYYIIYTPKNVFFSNMSYMRWIIIIELILCFVTGIILSLYFSTKNYKPIGRILKILSDQSDLNSESSLVYYYKLLEHTLSDLKTANGKLKKEICSKDVVLEEHVIACALKGDNLLEEWGYNYKEKLINNYNGRYYKVILFAFNHMESSLLFSDLKYEDNTSAYSLSVFLIRNVLDELALQKKDSPFSIGITLEIDNMIACILPVKRSDGEYDKELEKMIHQCIHFFKEAFKIDSYATISMMHTGWEELRKAYMEAWVAMSHKSFWGDELEDIIFYNKELTDDSTDLSSLFNLDQYKKLSILLINKEYNKASEQLDIILEQLFIKDLHSLEYNRSQAVFIVVLISKELTTVINDDSDFIYDNESSNSETISCVIERLLSIKSLELLKKEIHTILEELREQYNNYSKKRAPQWIQKVKEYMDKNYCNSNINISTIANEFNMAMSYMSTIYKKYTNTSMLDYIHLLRLKRCKELLSQGISIKECASLTGYSESKALIRAFKRYEGITPGQFKSKFIE